MGAIGAAPVIETARLRLRGHRLDDFEASAAMWADAAVTLHIGGTPSTRARSWARLLNAVGHWALMGFGYWAVEERSSGHFAGEVGFADFKREIQPSLVGMAEAGWVFDAAFWGRGYATEAVAAALGWADANLEFKQTACIIDPANLASIRVAEKCGYRADCVTELDGRPVRMFFRAGRGP